MNIYALMVIYNRPVEESCVYRFLRKTEGIQVVVCDNSTMEQDNQTVVEQDGGFYIALTNNGGLARAYNAGIRRIFEKGGTARDFVCLFDDDSVLEENYFEALTESIYRDANEVFLPVVEDAQGIMSPAVLPHLYCRRIKSYGELLKTPRRKLTGINSGMAVKLSVFEDFSYDERYFMDYIDHDFILKMRRKKIYPKLMDTHIRQNFSADTDSAQEAVERFTRQRKDLRLFYDDKTFGRAAYTYVVCKKRLKMMKKYKRFDMLYRQE